MIKCSKCYGERENISEGTEISEETYDRLLNAMPPISLSKSLYCGFQICEPYDYDFDNGNLRALYLTFVNINDKYYYAGINFGGECKWRLSNGLVDTCDVEEVVDGADRFSGIWTVSIKDREDADMDIWTASFSTEEKADVFKNAAEEKLKAYGVFDTVDVTKDMSHLDNDMYLDWIDARYGEEGEWY